VPNLNQLLFGVSDAAAHKHPYIAVLVWLAVPFALWKQISIAMHVIKFLREEKKQ
jgi:hypothetical protein